MILLLAAITIVHTTAILRWYIPRDTYVTLKSHQRLNRWPFNGPPETSYWALISSNERGTRSGIEHQNPHTKTPSRELCHSKSGYDSRNTIVQKLKGIVVSDLSPLKLSIWTSKSVDGIVGESYLQCGSNGYRHWKGRH